MNPRRPGTRLGTRVSYLDVPTRLRESSPGMLLPQGSILANWVLATMSSRGIASLSAQPQRSDAARCEAPSSCSSDRLEHLCRKLGDGDADQFFRAVLASHFDRRPP